MGRGGGFHSQETYYYIPIIFSGTCAGKKISKY